MKPKTPKKTLKKISIEKLLKKRAEREKKPLIIVNDDGIIVGSNHPAAELLGFNREEELFGEKLSLYLEPLSEDDLSNIYRTKITETYDEFEQHQSPISKGDQIKLAQNSHIENELLNVKNRDGRRHLLSFNLTELNIQKEAHYCIEFQPLEQLLEEREKLREKIEELRIQASINEGLQYCRTTEELFDFIMHQLISLKHLKIQKKGGILLLEQSKNGYSPCNELYNKHETKYLRLVYAIGDFPEEFLQGNICIPLERNICSKAVLTGKIVVKDNCSEDPLYRKNSRSKISPHGHYIIPIKDQNQVFGIIFLYTDPNPDRSLSRLTLLETIGTQTGAFYKRIKTEEELRRSYAKIKKMAMIDDLTQIMNRRSIFHHLKKEWARAKRHNFSISILLIDIDHFKKINDRFGHPVGDIVLRKIAKRIRDTVRPYDGIGRYGGEEFIVILSNCSTDEAYKVAERIRTTVSSEPFTIGDLNLYVTISIGVASSSAPPKEKPEEIIQLADLALYEAKNSGRNCIRIKKVEEFENFPEQIYKYPLATEAPDSSELEAFSGKSNRIPSVYKTEEELKTISSLFNTKAKIPRKDEKDEDTKKL